MKLYHGSTVIVDKTLVSYSRDKKGIISIYYFDDTDIQKKYHYKKFPSDAYLAEEIMLEQKE